MIPTIFGIMLVSFAIVQFVPGGPVERGDPGVSMQDGQHHGKPIAIEADREPPRARSARVDEGLHLDKQGSRPFERNQHARAGDRIAVR